MGLRDQAWGRETYHGAGRWRMGIRDRAWDWEMKAWGWETEHGTGRLWLLHLISR